MSSLTAVEEGTLRRSHSEDDSLCTGEFEIISCESISREPPSRHEHDTPHWSLQHSINVASMVPVNNLSSLLCSTQYDPAFLSLRTATEGCQTSPGLESPLSEVASVKCSDASVLTETIVTHSLSGSAHPEAVLSTESGSILENVLQSQSETREMLERVIMSLNFINKDRFETDNQLCCPHERLWKEVDENSTEPSSLKQQVVELQKQLFERGLEVDTRSKALREMTVELEAAYRKITDLTDSHSLLNDKCKELSGKLDETFALLVAERERVALAEDQIRSFHSGNEYSVVNEKMVIREMREKDAYAQKLESELEKASYQLNDLSRSYESKDVELRTHLEIINVLKE
ncbi:hypothetical protein DICVIV_11391, partial [Dictyocaulus viviparus]